MMNSDTLKSFSTARMFTITKRVLKQITRDRRTFGMIVMMPILIMVVFGFALSGEVKNTPVLLENADTGFAGTIIHDFMENDDRINLKIGNYQEGVDKVEAGEYRAAILIPNDFSASLIAKAQGQNATLEIILYVDATKPTIRLNILSTLQDALSEALGESGVELSETIAYKGSEQTGLDVAIPAVMAFVLTFLVMLISLITMVRELTTGTQNRLYTTPLTKVERLFGFVLALALFGFIEVAAILVISIYIFGASVQGNLVLLLISAFFYAFVNVLLSVFLSNFAENELQAVQMAPLVGLPSMALSGMLVPISTLPSGVRFISNFIPMKYAINIFEGIMLKGFGFAELWSSYLILFVFFIVLLGLSLLTVKDHLDD
ncbi:MAG: Inner membrane transport permease YbhS [Candidatus Heimdallarchaeota archaeon LC_2]|nr:MAG: Inner membrane transport permease YbhS [Candidatus Heimdallarchaeota archaeon LC_2]